MTRIVLHVSAGAGPEECEWVVARLAAAYCKEAAKAKIACELVEPVEGPCPSLLLQVEGAAAEAFVSPRVGTVRWIGASPMRPQHKRKNWFVGVSRVEETAEALALDDRDITYQSFRASGPGGQHVNKTESAVRAVHRVTGLSAVSQDQRSQQANKKIARLKLVALLQARAEEDAARTKSDTWQRNNAIERGNAVRTYEGAAFKLRG